MGPSLYKEKKARAWTQVVCLSHTDPKEGQSAKCNRARTFRNLKALKDLPEEFEVENQRTLQILKQWLVADHLADGFVNDRVGHMDLPTDFKIDELEDLDVLDEKADRS